MMMKVLVAGGLPPLTDNLMIADDYHTEGFYDSKKLRKCWMEISPGLRTSIYIARGNDPLVCS